MLAHGVVDSDNEVAGGQLLQVPLGVSAGGPVGDLRLLGGLGGREAGRGGEVDLVAGESSSPSVDHVGVAVLQGPGPHRSLMPAHSPSPSAIRSPYPSSALRKWATIISCSSRETWDRLEHRFSTSLPFSSSGISLYSSPGWT